MKSAMIIGVLLSLTQIVFAKALDSSKRAEKVMTRLERAVMNMEGVNGIFVTGCDPITGQKSDFQSDFVHCVGIFTETKEAEQKLLEGYPLGTQIKGVFIVVEYVGPIIPDPRMSGGN